jgi:hypothetical protein
MLHRYLCAGIVLLALGGTLRAEDTVVRGFITHVSKTAVTLEVAADGNEPQTFRFGPSRDPWVYEAVSSTRAQASSLAALRHAIQAAPAGGVNGFVHLDEQGRVSCVEYLPLNSLRDRPFEDGF